MTDLKPYEVEFLREKQKEAGHLKAEIDSIMEEYQPLTEEYNSIQRKIEELVNQQVALRKKMYAIAPNLGQIQKDYADVTRDVTRLLRKQRGVPDV